MSNHQSDGKNALKRVEFMINGETYKFMVNPEEYSMSEPNRATPVQTKGGIWVDEFGSGIKTIQFQGTTGFKVGSTDPTRGYSKFKKLQEIIREVYDRATPGQVVPLNKELYFYNYTDAEYWIVTPLIFELHRTIARPLLYTYNVTLICNRKASEPYEFTDDFIPNIRPYSKGGND